MERKQVGSLLTRLVIYFARSMIGVELFIVNRWQFEEGKEWSLYLVYRITRAHPLRVSKNANENNFSPLSEMLATWWKKKTSSSTLSISQPYWLSCRRWSQPLSYKADPIIDYISYKADSIFDFIYDAHFCKFSTFFKQANVKDWLTKYEMLTDMVVPQSTNKIFEDNEHALFTVTLFHKVVDEFKHHAR